jgi:hypothetical protein
MGWACLILPRRSAALDWNASRAIPNSFFSADTVLPSAYHYATEAALQDAMLNNNQLLYIFILEDVS